MNRSGRMRRRARATGRCGAPRAARICSCASQDVPAVLDQLEAWNKTSGHQLAGRLDLTRVGMSGHSFGAITTQAVSGQTFPLAGPRLRRAAHQGVGHLQSEQSEVRRSEDGVRRGEDPLAPDDRHGRHRADRRHRPRIAPRRVSRAAARRQVRAGARRRQPLRLRRPPSARRSRGLPQPEPSPRDHWRSAPRSGTPTSATTPPPAPGSTAAAPPPFWRKRIAGRRSSRGRPVPRMRFRHGACCDRGI